MTEHHTGTISISKRAMTDELAMIKRPTDVGKRCMLFLEAPSGPIFLHLDPENNEKWGARENKLRGQVRGACITKKPRH